MIPENSSAAAPVDTSPSLAEYIGDLHGDYSPSVEPEPDADAPSVSTPEIAASSEGTSESVPAAEPAAEADPASVPDQSTTPTTDTDPLEGSTPYLAYTVNGEERKFEGLTVLKDGSAFIESPEAVQHLQRIVGERDHLFERSREQFNQLSALESISTWTPPGASAPVTGRAAVEALHTSRAELLAEVQAYQNLLSNPENLREILAVNEDGSLAWNSLATKNFLLELNQTKGKVTAAVAQHFAKLSPAQQAQVTATAPAFDAVKAAPAVVDFAVKSASITGLTDADKQWAASLAPRFVRTATAADVRETPTLRMGEPMLDQDFIDLLQDRAARNTATSKAVSSAAAVAQANAAKINAAKLGGPSNKQHPRLPAQPTPERTREDDFDEAYERQRKGAAGALRAHAVGL